MKTADELRAAAGLIRVLVGVLVIAVLGSVYPGIETLRSTARPGMPRWQEALFAWMSRNTQRAMTSFEVPADRVVELGVQLDL